MPFFDEHLELLDPDGFLDSFSSLVTTYRDSYDPSGYQEVYVKLAHFTVREYLSSGAIRNSPCSNFYTEAKLAHACLARSCLAYFHYAIKAQVDDPDILDDIMALDPLIIYAGHFWIKHKRLSDGDGGFEQSFRSTLLDIFDVRKPYYEIWLKVANIDRPWLKQESHNSADYSPLYCAAYVGLSHVTATLLQRGADPDATGGIYGNALQAASFNGHLQVVRELLRAKVDVDAECGACGSALAAAAARGHTEIARELIGAGASVIERQRWRRHGQRLDPLYQAVIGGHLAVCELLLEHGAEDFYHMKGKPPSALQASVTTGRLDIVKTLLKYKQIRAANDPSAGCSALIRPVTSGFAASQYDAAVRGQIDILRELLAYGIETDEAFRYAARAGDEALVLEHLDKGVDIDSHGSVSDHPRALQSAALGGHLYLVRHLLARGADPNLVSDYSTAMDAAVQGGNIEVVKVLIDAGADLNGRFSGPLYTALNSGRDDIAELLVRHGAGTHRVLSDFTLKGSFQSFRLLLKLGADPHRKDPDDKLSMLGKAAWGGSIPIVRYLLENGFEHQLNSEVAETTPLIAAICAERWLVVPLLLECGADANAPPPEKSELPPRGGVIYNGQVWPLQPPHESSLTLAIKAKNPDIARSLIQYGAQVTPLTPVTAGTPLLYAVFEGFTELARELLQAGADPKQRGTILRQGKPTFPLRIAAEKANLEIVTHLIDAGATVDDQDEEGFSALHAAAAGRNGTETLEALIRDHGADLKVQLLNGSRPIHSAASKGTAYHVKVLLDAGASLEDKNKTGRTPLHWAAESGNWDTLELLLDQGADVNVKANEGGAAIPLDLAFLAKEKPSWQIVANSAQWGDERVDMLLQRLKTSK